MSNSTDISFREYKSEASLYGLTKDLFFESEASKFGCYEDDFLKWLREQRLFIKRFSEYLNSKLDEICLPERKWGFFQFHYERSKRTEYLINTFPSGFFEAVGKNGEVACFLPDTYGYADKPFRISLYRSDGPTYHDVFKTRLDALTFLANRGYKPLEGALDRLVGTDAWDRGLQVTKWIAEGLHPVDGLKRDKHIPEIAELFPES
jgi:hypothetical protein